MGGSSQGRPPIGDLSELERKAKQELQATSGEGKRNVFISFDGGDLNDVNLFRGQAKNEDNDLEFSDWSVREPYNSSQAAYIKQKIRERIRRSSVTVVYVSEKTSSSEWVNWEIEESLALGKKVVAFHAGNSPPASLPAAITKNKIKLIRWTQAGLARAIGEAAEN